MGIYQGYPLASEIEGKAESGDVRPEMVKNDRRKTCVQAWAKEGEGTGRPIVNTFTTEFSIAAK